MKMPDAILRTVNLPRYDATLTLERSAMYHKKPYVIMGELHGVRYPERYCASDQEAHEYLDQVEAEYRDGNSGSKPKKKSKKSIARAGMKRLRGYLKASYDELAILDYLSRGMSYPRIARETRTSRDDVARKVIDICNKVKAPSIEALKNGYIEWVEG